MVLTASRSPDTRHLALVFTGVILQQATAENKWDYVIAGKTNLDDSVGSV